MADPAPDEWSATHIARIMHPELPDKLANLENIMLANMRANRSRLAHPLRRRIWAGVVAELFTLLVALPLALAFLFITDGSWLRLRHEDDAYAGVVAGILCMVGLVVLAIFFARWRRVRLRDRMGTILSALYVGVGAAGVWSIHTHIEHYDRRTAWIVLPVWLFFGLSLASLVLQLRSPRTVAWDIHFGLGTYRSDHRRIDVRRLHPDDHAQLLEDRNVAIRILAERGLIDAADVDELVTRPLGALHRPSPSRHGDA